ncbi:endoglucanase, partial [Actinoplanes sp. NPDC049681]
MRRSTIRKTVLSLSAVFAGIGAALAGPAGAQAAPAAPAAAAGECVTDARLVPSCGVLWGAAAGGFTDAPRDTALKDWEKLSGRT